MERWKEKNVGHTEEWLATTNCHSHFKDTTFVLWPLAPIIVIVLLALSYIYIYILNINFITFYG